MGNIKTTVKKFSTLVSALALMFSVTGLTAHAAPAVTITAPTSASVLANGGSVPVSGTAPANTRVKVLLDGVQASVATTNGSGTWNTTLTNVVKGAHTLKAVNSEPGLHYYATAGSPSQLHSIDPLTGAIDTRSGFPITVAGLTPVALPHPNGNIAYVTGFQFETGNLQKVNLQTGVVQQVPGYPNQNTNVGAFTPDGSKYYSANNDGTITIVDVASNTVDQTLVTGATTHNSAVLIDDLIYASDVNTGLITVINPVDNSFTSFAPACPSGGKAVSVVPDPDDSNVLWSTCDNGYILKTNKTTHAAIMTAALPNAGAGLNKVPGVNKIFVASPASTDVYVLDSENGTLLQTITAPATNFAPVSTSDGSRVLLSAPGVSFSGSDAMIINVADYSVVPLNLSGPTLALFSGPDTVAEASVQFTVSEVLASTGENIRNISLLAGAVAVLSISALVYRKRKFSK